MSNVSEVMKEMIRQQLLTLHTCLICKVLRVYANDTAKVHPLTMVQTKAGEVRQHQALDGVPIADQAKSSIKVGSICVVVFAERDVARAISGEYAIPSPARHHSLSDGLIIGTIGETVGSDIPGSQWCAPLSAETDTAKTAIADSETDAGKEVRVHVKLNPAADNLIYTTPTGLYAPGYTKSEVDAKLKEKSHVTMTVHQITGTKLATITVNGTAYDVYAPQVPSQEQIDAWTAAAEQAHTHTNKDVLDDITAAYTEEEREKLSGIEDGANKYVHPTHTAHTVGLYKIANDAQGHVTAATEVSKSDITGLGIPGSDTNTTYRLSKSGSTITLTGSDGNSTSVTDADTVYTHPSYTARPSGLYKITVDSSGHVSDVKAVSKSDITALDIPGSDTNTTYSAGTGLSLSGTTFNHKNSVTAKATAALVKVKYDAQGHVTGSEAVAKADITALGIPGNSYITLRGGDFTFLRSDGTVSGTGAINCLYEYPADSYDAEEKTVPYGTAAAAVTNINPHVNFLEDSYMSDGYTAYPVFYQASDGDTSSGKRSLVASKKVRMRPTLAGFEVDGVISAQRFEGASATQSSAGLMSTDDKKKLDGIATGANAYTHPSYTARASGLYKITVDSTGHISGTASVTASDLPSHTHSYLPLSGGTLTSSTFGALEIARSGSTNGASIEFTNSSGTLGYIGMNTTADSGLKRWTADTKTSYTVLDSGNFDDYALPVNGNAASATKLQTARAINGGYFDGTSNITIPIRSCYAYDESSTYASAPWHKVASCSITSTYTDAILIMHVDKGCTGGGHSGILRARVRTGSTKGVRETSALTWEYANASIIPENFVLVYTNDATSGKCTAELWVKITNRYDGWQFTILSQSYRTATSNAVWTFYNSKSGEGEESYTDGTGVNVSSLLSLSNSTKGNADTATALTTSAGSAARPVYFSDGKPVAGTYTLGAACAKGVSDSSSASAISTGTNLPTERDIYYGLPTINGSHTYTSSTNIYAPTSVGTSGYVPVSKGSGAPSWQNGRGISVGKDTDGETYTYNGTAYSGSSTAEIFNDYSANFSAGDYSHVEGSENLGLANCCHVEGWKNVATAVQSHAGGTSSTASGEGAFVHGKDCTASTAWSAAMGDQSTAATGNCAFAFGWGVTNLTGNSLAVGQWNAQSKSGLFVVGKGASSGSKANAFRVASNGTTYATGAYNSTGADYAEMFEWLDGNPDGEDRRGRFVTLDGEKIKLAESPEDDIIGVISAAASIIGDAHEDVWNGMYLTDIFGGAVYDEPVIGEDGNWHRYQTLNPDYDSTQEYIPRTERKEWDAVGLMGKLVVVDDGTCQVNSYCVPAEGGIATASSDRVGYRVLSRLDDTHIKILMR